MDLIALTETLIKSVSSMPESVRVKEFPTDEEGVTLIQVMVDQNDMGKVLGKKGKVANSIRTIVQASAYYANKKVKINIDSY